jgi:hypothetical protein
LRLPALLGLSVPACAASAALGVAGAAPSGSRTQVPKWDVTGRWDGANGAEYVLFRQRRGGRLDLTIHHTCAPGHVERGSGRIRGDRVTGRVEPVEKPQPAGCVPFATIDMRVVPDGREMRGTWATDGGGGPLVYIPKRRARSLVRFSPSISVGPRTARGRSLFVRVRPNPPLPDGAAVRVKLCRGAFCKDAEGRRAVGLRWSGRRCGTLRARVSFAGSRAFTRRDVCT